MLMRLLLGVLVLVVSGCAAESRTIYFLPVDLVRIAPRNEDLVSAVEVRVTDHREDPTLHAVRGSGKEVELALYPGVVELLHEMITTAADSVLAADLSVPPHIALECDVAMFDVSAQPMAGRTRVIVRIEVTLRLDGRQWEVKGAQSHEFAEALARKHYQDVIHAALTDVANDVRAAMTEFAERREI